MRSFRPVEKQWLFTHSALNNTPSLDDGIDLQTELKRRKVIIEYMRSLALRANAIINGDDAEVPRLRGSMIVGATLIHRFYMRRSFKDFPEKLIAPTILFLATKIEEEPLKLRHIVNVCIAKFEQQGTKGWYPDINPHEQPPREYRTWEKSILATEEVVLEALCFDMGVEQPYTKLLRSIKGLDEVIGKVTLSSSSSGANGMVNGTGKGKEKLTESVITEFSWTLLSESSCSPLSILYPVQIISFIIFTIVISIADQIPLSEGLWNASELSERFGLDLILDQDTQEVRGDDLDLVKSCLDGFMRYMHEGLIDEGLKRYIVAEPEEGTKEPYKRRFTSTTTNGTSIKDDIKGSSQNDLSDVKQDTPVNPDGGEEGVRMESV
ncbi:hypothetical protein I302_101586 [Kwoniella bestiolae CBS 10118]|uniref:Cyclin N-terminal domain-containing protein n=1 Tax=Kwoniella bestiolae CBS 10118 TaxID=1296100 RepID=A0A1B9GCN6_9TREE|nr:hypothetical protein I302_00268 [Kwoniella bestiolae CBS 10118]OCF28779.1 hypothetical protein I302_00268 [Kwoniella bestiolae CBS 10118]